MLKRGTPTGEADPVYAYEWTARLPAENFRKAIEVRPPMHVVGNASNANASPPSSISFAVSQREPDALTSVLEVEGELDLTSAPSLKWALSDALDAGRSRIVVDLSLVTFIDSTALGVLVGAQRSLSPGTRLAVVCTHVAVLRIFELTGLDGTFHIFPTIDSALDYVRGSAAGAV
jgi:anti-sigma B factor antagonist